MNFIHFGVIYGQSLVAVVGIILGLVLVAKWTKTHNRSMIHFAVYFLGCGSFLLRAFIDMGYGNPELFSRVLYLVGMIALYGGVLPGVLLLIPFNENLKQTIYKAVPAVILVITLLVTAFAPTEQTDVGLYVFKQPYHLIFVRLLHAAAGLFAIGSLLYLSFELRNSRPAIMAIAFVFILIGTIFMGTHEPKMIVVGSVMQALGLVAFFFAFVVLSKQ